MGRHSNSLEAWGIPALGVVEEPSERMSAEDVSCREGCALLEDVCLFAAGALFRAHSCSSHPCCSVAAPERCKEVALVLKAMYDDDLAEDEIIVAWGGKADAAKGLGVPAAAAAAVRKAAGPVIDWLQEDDEDDEDDE